MERPLVACDTRHLYQEHQLTLAFVITNEHTTVPPVLSELEVHHLMGANGCMHVRSYIPFQVSPIFPLASLTSVNLFIMTLSSILLSNLSRYIRQH